ncbi:DUF2637 domain-containing protein [Streptomyces adelaidensis]|uniref:DUF2637 domain-containing protein n=1 Tax=Streptomyces adelaidensis TaxID=2796465 RepID=UPI0027DC8B70|nr:DUF2637 domain-containing protein [Streptomyces adelaidensis]
MPDSWDPAEELAQLLSTAAEVVPDADPLDGPPRRRSRRRGRTESHSGDDRRRITHVTILIVMIAVCAVAMLGWSIAYSYDQLRTAASSVLPARLAGWWPLTVYGPWFVAALSILRATVQNRTAVRSWCVILAASAMAVALSVTHSSHTLLSLVIVGIPPITALVCFWELVGQVPSKIRPRHALHAQKHSKPRNPYGTP